MNVSQFKTELKTTNLQTIQIDELSRLQRKSFLEADDDQVEEEDNTLYYQTMDQRLNYKLDPLKITDTKFAWVHVSCASFLPEVRFTYRSAIKLTKLKLNVFEHTCIICHQRQGACIRCSHPDCQIYMHVECARRAKFYVDIDRDITNHDDLEREDNFEKKTKKLE